MMMIQEYPWSICVHPQDFDYAVSKELALLIHVDIEGPDDCLSVIIASNQNRHSVDNVVVVVVVVVVIVVVFVDDDGS